MREYEHLLKKNQEIQGKIDIAKTGGILLQKQRSLKRDESGNLSRGSSGSRRTFVSR